MNLSQHFTLEELTASEFGERMGINNQPTPEILTNLYRLARGLDAVRSVLHANPIHVNSGYRRPLLNSMLHGAVNSMHMQGLAADILCPGYGNPLDVALAIQKANLETDQIIHEFGRWCHVAFAAEGTKPRGQVLTIRDVQSGYQEGLF